MAIRYAVAAGNWSDAATWDGGVTLPTVGDTVYSNTFIVTINQDILVDKITNNICPTTGLSGGSFNNTASRNILCTVESFNQTCLTLSGVISVTTGALIPINAKVIYFSVTSGGISRLTVIGDCSASDNANTIEISGNGAGRQININIIGNGNSTASKQIIKNNGSVYLQSLNVTGNFTSGGAICFDSPIVAFVGVGSFKASATASVIVGATTCLGSISGTLENVNSRMAVVFNSMYLSPTTSLVWKFYASDGSAKPLYTADVVENPPAESDVRDGVVYGIGDAYEGTLNVGATPAEFVAALVASDLGLRMAKCAVTEEVLTMLENLE